MKVKKVRIPRIIDLGCNGKATAIVDSEGNALLVSYVTPIAYAMLEKCGGRTRRTIYKLWPELCSNTTKRHWNAFVVWEGHPELKGSKCYRELPYTQCV